jgi:hypothetical protein
LCSQEIIKSLNNWLSSFSEESSASICALYDVNASLWGTLSPIKRNNQSLIKDYFDQLFKFESRNVELNDSNIRILGDIAICNGQYTFAWIENGVKTRTKARFSFVYIKKNEEWFIVEHHSSVKPESPNFQ